MQSTLRQNQNLPRQICKYEPEYHSGIIGELWVFGPHYRAKELDFRRNAKEDALNFVLEKSGCTLPKLLNTLEDIEEEARATYADDSLNSLPRVKFLEMMAVDGCFFLLLAFSILGGESGGKEVGFSEEHLIFGIECFREKMDIWFNSMFVVGNQIPLIVLEEIMKLRFFQELKKEKQWKQPLDVVKRAIYNFLMVDHQSKPVDLIHCLQSIFLGRKSGSHVTVPIMDLDAGDAIEKIDRYTELTVKCLQEYEIVQASRGIEPDVTPYFCTPKDDEDVEVLISQGLIQGRLEGLPGLLSSIAGMELSEHLRQVRREIRDHPPQQWQKCIKLAVKLIGIIAAILVLILLFCKQAKAFLGY